MDNYLIKCNTCNGWIRGVEKITEDHYRTDFGDIVTDKCPICNNKTQFKQVTTCDWIAKLFFQIKGEKQF